MLQIKKIKEQLFPRLLGFPEDVSQRFADEMNDGLLLYDPEHTNADGVRMPRYHCLQCRAYGEMSRDSQICCPKCGNERFRPLKKDRHDSNSRRQYRLIQSMGEYVLVRDFVLYVQENVEKGIVTNNEENFRLVLKNGEIAAFKNAGAFAGDAYVNEWRRVNQIYEKHQAVKTIVESCAVYDDCLLKGNDDKIALPIGLLYDKLMEQAVEKRMDSVPFPIVNFRDPDFSLISKNIKWTAKMVSEKIPNSDEFKKTVSWCTGCGKYRETLRDKSHYYLDSGERCLYCGSAVNNVSAEASNYLIDAAETEDESVVLSVMRVCSYWNFDGELEFGVDPKRVLEHSIYLTNYIYIRSDGQVYFYNDKHKEIEKLQAANCNRRHTKMFYYSERALIIRKNKTVGRTGFPKLADSNGNPKYFERYRNMPCMEIFAKMEMYALVVDIIESDEKNIPQYMRKTGKDSRLGRLSKPQINSLRQSHCGLNDIVAYMQVLNKDPEALYSTFYELSSASHSRHVLDILRVGVPTMTVEKIQEYIRRVDDAQCCPAAESMQLWSDYLRMLKTLECDLTDNKLVFPNSLKREHDKAARKVTQIKDEKLNQKFIERAEKNKWLEYSSKQLSVIVPEDMAALYEEGRKLSHCVGAYAQNVANGNSLIAFVRRKEHMNEPFCTVEVRDKTIVQARGFSNRPAVMIPGVRTFLEEWSGSKGLEIAV